MRSLSTAGRLPAVTAPGLAVVAAVYAALAAFFLLRGGPWMSYAAACPTVPNGLVVAATLVVGLAVGLGWRSRPALVLLVPLLAVPTLPPLADPFTPWLEAVARWCGALAVAGTVETGRRLRGDGSPGWVALATVLLAVLAVGVPVFLTGLGDPLVAFSPQASFEHTYHAENDTLLVRHDGGDRLTGNLRVLVNGESAGVRLSANRTVENGRWVSERGAPAAATVPVGAGDSVRVHGVDPGDEVRVVWRSRRRCESSTLALVDVARQRELSRRITSELSPQYT